ncbi:zinc finger FYVE domain-containing protein 16 isoform X1 [Macrobrachium rosenbergii]|uniref:zinc finger FYVE domain-containing protein 16 isoform X1 n=1 Tax=Macrobrachium rosenbergii TaxID=79674 RepID=UPI0034D4E0B3
MEKFAVDLDKVLDEFELDEDESESVNQYEKLQLEFCPDGGTSHPSSATMRHSIGLGAFGGWSEPLQPQQQAVESVGPPAQPWCGSSLSDDAPQPPGTRSPPDGQNDDSQQSATCSQHLSSLSFQQPMSLQPQPQLPPMSVPSETSGSRIQPGLSQQPRSSSALWPVMATSSINSFSRPTVPEISSERSVEGYRMDAAGSAMPSLPALPPDYMNPSLQERGATGECGASEKFDSGSGLMDNHQPVRGLDVITSRPLDIVPSNIPPESRVVSGHEGRHPDIIDVWQSGSEGHAASPPREVTPPLVPENSIGAIPQEVVPEPHQDEGENSGNVEQPEHRLLPDLMSMNAAEVGQHAEGHAGGGEYPEPAVVMENTLANSNANDPVIVKESQSYSRIPEVVNVHQTAENSSQAEMMSRAVRGDSPSPQLPEESGQVPHEEDSQERDIVGAFHNHSNPVCDSIVRSVEMGLPDGSSVDGPVSSHSSLPDVSSVNPVPISFSKDVDVDDAYLDAELAELEEEQFRLQGAYGGSLTGSVASIRDNVDNSIVHPQDSGRVGGPDLIDGMSASYPVHDAIAQASSKDSAVPVEPESSSGMPKREGDGVGAAGLLPETSSTLQTHGGSAAGFSQYEVSSVEEVVCHPHNNEMGGNHARETGHTNDVSAGGGQSVGNSDTLPVRSSDGDGEDNVSNASTGTDTMSSSSTLTDGDLGSPERRAQHSAPSEPDSPSRVMPGTLVTAVYDDDSGSGREDESSEAVGGAEGTTETTSSSRSRGDGGNLVGQVAPFWIPDDDAPNCQECGQKFTVIRRRHHCRACGRVLCAPCCHHKAPLPYMDYKEARVCGPCLHLIQLDQSYERDGEGHGGQPKQSDHQRKPPDPNNPMEYCSRVPPPQQVGAIGTAPPPTVMVPVGVLKREGSCSGSSRNRGSKQVIFSDGIRPGGDLTELDGSGELLPPYRRTGRVARRVDRPTTGSSGGEDARGPGGLLRSLPPDRCLIPPGAGLPPVVVKAPNSGEYVFEDNPDSSKLEEQLRGDGPPVVFAVRKNLTVLVKVVKLECCVGVEVWNIATRGLCTVGQEEMVILLEVAPGESHPPRDVFGFFQTVYKQANQGNLVTEMGHTIFTEPEGFLGSREHGGFLYIRPTFQCLRNLVLPPSPYIFAVLIQKWETPWAKVFPLRLMLRMGAEFRYYPCPLVSTRNRKPVFCEIGHTIMNLLVDFRNYAYTVPTIEGFVIHMEDKKTSLLFPKNRYEQVTKALNNSNDHVLALGANFSPQADSHLVTIENDDGHYSTQAINIHNRPRKVTGASFIVFNGALKTTSGLSAKSSIVEDGLMVQIPADMMTKLRDALRNMKEFDIPCGPVTAEQPDEVVVIRWTSDDKNFNVGIKSAVDEKQMDGIPSVKIHSGTDYVSNAHLIRWTEVFILQGETNNSNDINLSRLSEILARAFCVALTPHLAEMYANGHTRLGLRSTIHQDSVGYEAGSSGSRLPAPCMNDLDTELIPVIHRAAANVTDEPIILELVFHIMEQ